MGIMDMIKGLFNTDKGQQVADAALDKVADIAKDKVGPEHADKVDAVRAQIDEHLGTATAEEAAPAAAEAAPAAEEAAPADAENLAGNAGEEL